MDQHPAQPEPGGLEIETLPSIDVPQSDWPSHSLLRRAQINSMGDGLEWPKATFEQLPLLRAISLIADDGIIYARLSSEFNFDRFVDATTSDDDPAQPPGHMPDRQRFYTRVTDNGFHVVGVFSAATIAGRRRYFQWLTGAWVEIGLSGFLYVRDDLDTHFSEVTGAQLEETQPGATTTPMTAEDEWTAESVQSQFVGDPMVEGGPRAAGDPNVEQETGSAPVPASNSGSGDEPKSMFEPVIEPDIDPSVAPLTAATFPHIAPPVPHSIDSLLPPPAAESDSRLPVEQVQPESEAVVGPASVPESAPAQAPAQAPTGSATAAPAGAAGSDAAAAIQRGIAVALATVAHRNDVDLLGAPMIDHVARVAETFDAKNDHVRHCAAWLHDALERTDLTERELLEAGIQAEVVEIVVLLTRKEGVSNDAWFAAISENPDARAIKINAIRDNAAPWRLRRLEPATRAEIERVHAEALAALNIG